MKNNFNDFVSRPREVICILFDNVNEIEGRIVVVKHLGAVSIGDHVHDCTPKETQSSTLALIQLQVVQFVFEVLLHARKTLQT